MAGLYVNWPTYTERMSNNVERLLIFSRESWLQCLSDNGVWCDLYGCQYIYKQNQSVLIV